MQTIGNGYTCLTFQSTIGFPHSCRTGWHAEIFKNGRFVAVTKFADSEARAIDFAKTIHGDMRGISANGMGVCK